MGKKEYKKKYKKHLLEAKSLTLKQENEKGIP